MMYPVVEAKDVTVNYIASSLRNAYIQILNIDIDDNRMTVRVDDFDILISIIDNDAICMLVYRRSPIYRDGLNDIYRFINKINQQKLMKFIIIFEESETLPKEQIILHFLINGCMRFDYGLNVAQLISDLRSMCREYREGMDSLVDFLKKEKIWVD